MFIKYKKLFLSCLLVQIMVNGSDYPAALIWGAFRRAGASGDLSPAENDQNRAQAVSQALSTSDIHKFVYGNTPLHHAIWCAQPLTVQALLTRGANPSLLNQLEKKDALGYAQYLLSDPRIYYKDKGIAMRNIIATLKDAKANLVPSIPDKAPISPDIFAILSEVRLRQATQSRDIAVEAFDGLMVSSGSLDIGPRKAVIDFLSPVGVVRADGSRRMQSEIVVVSTPVVSSSQGSMSILKSASDRTLRRRMQYQAAKARLKPRHTDGK